MKSIFQRKNGYDSHKSNKLDDDKNIHTLKEWNWKLEQSLTQLRSRINAVENRLSLNKNEEMNQHDLHLIKNDEGIHQFERNEENNSLICIIQKYEKMLDEFDHDYHEMKSQIDRLSQKQKSSSIIMHVKGKEIPLEITGIIGGTLVILIAFLVGIGGANFVISPLFLSIIGMVLIGSTLFRSLGGIEMIKSFYQKRIDAIKKS